MFKYLLVFSLLLLSLSPPGYSQGDEKLDINLLKSQLELTETHTPFDLGSFGEIFDGNTNTLARCSASNNPMVVTLTFSDQLQLTRSRVNSATPAQWTMEVANNLGDLNAHTGSYIKLFGPATINANTFYTQQFPSGTTATIVRITLYRTNADFYPHLREWELYGSYAPLPVSVTLEPADEHIAVNGTQQYIARGERIDGSFYTIPGASLTWNSGDTDVADVDPSGTATGLLSGRTLITATYTRGSNTVSGSTFLYVNPEGIVCK